MTRCITLVVVLGFVSSAAAQELTWRKDIQPIVQAACGACHGSNAPVYEEWNLDRTSGPSRTWDHAWRSTNTSCGTCVAATGSMMRRLDDGKNAGGKPGNMHAFLASTDAERAKNLQAIKDWLGGEARGSSIAGRRAVRSPGRPRSNSTKSRRNTERASERGARRAGDH